MTRQEIFLRDPSTPLSFSLFHSTYTTFSTLSFLPRLSLPSFASLTLSISFSSFFLFRHPSLPLFSPFFLTPSLPKTTVSPYDPPTFLHFSPPNSPNLFPLSFSPSSFLSLFIDHLHSFLFSFPLFPAFSLTSSSAYFSFHFLHSSSLHSTSKLSSLFPFSSLSSIVPFFHYLFILFTQEGTAMGKRIEYSYPLSLLLVKP